MVFPHYSSASLPCLRLKVLVWGIVFVPGSPKFKQLQTSREKMLVKPRQKCMWGKKKHERFLLCCTQFSRPACLAFTLLLSGVRRQAYSSNYTRIAGCLRVYPTPQHHPLITPCRNRRCAAPVRSVTRSGVSTENKCWTAPLLSMRGPAILLFETVSPASTVPPRPCRADEI